MPYIHIQHLGLEELLKSKDALTIFTRYVHHKNCVFFLQTQVLLQNSDIYRSIVKVKQFMYCVFNDNDTIYSKHLEFLFSTIWEQDKVLRIYLFSCLTKLAFCRQHHWTSSSLMDSTDHWSWTYEMALQNHWESVLVYWEYMMIYQCIKFKLWWVVAFEILCLFLKFCIPAVHLHILRFWTIKNLQKLLFSASWN